MLVHFNEKFYYKQKLGYSKQSYTTEFALCVGIQSNARARNVTFNNIDKVDRECTVFYPLVGWSSKSIYSTNFYT